MRRTTCQNNDSRLGAACGRFERRSHGWGLAVKVGQLCSIEHSRVETKQLVEGGAVTTLHTSTLHTQMKEGRTNHSRQAAVEASSALTTI
jgi:hypothetical protein